MKLSPEALEVKREKDREYQRVWRKKNPEKNAINQAKYWENMARKVMEARKENK